MFSRILVPTDFSPTSDAALEYARVLAARFGASLRILHVIDDPTASSDFVAEGFAPSTENIRMGLQHHAHGRLEQLLTPTDRILYRAHVDALMGPPAATIVDHATATGSTLIVMGTHGRTGLAHLLMGSVAEQVVRSAPCPVLTVRQTVVADQAYEDAMALRVPVAV